MFNEIYGNYYRIMEEIISLAQKKCLDDKTMTDVILEKGFGESILTVPSSVTKWGLITENKETPVKNCPKRPLSLLEKRWLKTLLQDPKIRLFDINAEGLEDVKPLYSEGQIKYFDKYNDGDPYEREEYIRNFKAALKAIREGRKIHVKFATRYGQMRNWYCMPVTMEFSEKDDKFRLIVATGRRKSAINMARISHIELLDEREEIEIDIEPKQKLSATIFDERNALERAMLHFSTFEKETIRTGENEYTLNLYYSTEDESELLIRILQFGPFIKVHEPEGMVNLIKERLQMQSKYRA